MRASSINIFLKRLNDDVKFNRSISITPEDFLYRMKMYGWEITFPDIFLRVYWFRNGNKRYINRYSYPYRR